MLTLGKNQSFYGSSTSGNVAITIFGEDSQGARVLYNGFFSSAAPIFTGISATKIHSINMSVVNSDTTIKIFVGGKELRNRIFIADVPVSGTATYNNAGWRIFNAAGVPIGQVANNYFP